jgi:hypothetical protein
VPDGVGRVWDDVEERGISTRCVRHGAGARFRSLCFVCMGSRGPCMYYAVKNVLSGYLALSLGVAGSDRQAGVGAGWVGWWESSEVADRLKSGGVKLRHRYSIS